MRGLPLFVTVTGLRTRVVLHAVVPRRQRINHLGVEAHADKVAARYLRTVRDIRRFVCVARHRANQELFGRDALDPNATVLIIFGERRVELVVILIGRARNLQVLNLASLCLGDKAFNVNRADALVRCLLRPALVVPPNLDRRQLLQQRGLEPVVQDEKAVVVVLEYEVDVFGGLVCGLLILCLARIEYYRVFRRHERLEQRGQGIVNNLCHHMVNNR